MKTELRTEEQDGVQKNSTEYRRTWRIRGEHGGLEDNRTEYRRTGRSAGEQDVVQENSKIELRTEEQDRVQKNRWKYRRTGRSTGEQVEIQENRTEYMRINPLPLLLHPPPCPLSIPSQFVLFRRNIGFIRFVSRRFMRFQSKI